MIARGCEKADLEAALKAVNVIYGGNITFKWLEADGKGWAFTLGVVSSKGPGHRRSWNGRRRIAAACWHVHGWFFEELFKVAPTAKIWSSFFRRLDDSTSGWITAEGGNWSDGNIGSMMDPCRYSEACDCAEEGLPLHDGRSGVVARSVRQADMTGECWIVQFRGVEACASCEYRDTEDCGGVNIRRTGKNAKGFAVPLGKEV